MILINMKPVTTWNKIFELRDELISLSIEKYDRSERTLEREMLEAWISMATTNLWEDKNSWTDKHSMFKDEKSSVWAKYQFFKAVSMNTDYKFSFNENRDSGDDLTELGKKNVLPRRNILLETLSLGNQLKEYLKLNKKTPLECLEVLGNIHEKKELLKEQDEAKRSNNQRLCRSIR
ncbi:hypothetical protein AAH56_03735 [Campylobacter upsaliensis]|nr:hypothetical protein [Campylobacter upsaliensis]EAK9899346.1 hypothetical protein [Campylobacter upsaliensis]